MSRLNDLINQVSDESKFTLNQVLMKAKVLAYDMKSRKFRKWVDSELKGYDTNDVPTYRIVPTSCQGSFAGYGGSSVSRVQMSVNNIPDDFKGLPEFLRTARLTENVATLESLVNTDESELGMTMEFPIVQILRKYSVQVTGMKLNEVRKVMSVHAIRGVINDVRAHLLDFLLKLRDEYPSLSENDSDMQNVSSDFVDSVVDRSVYQNCTFVEGSNVGDVYQAGQAGAMGPNAKAENINFFQVLREGIGDASLADLAMQLEQLRLAMLSQAKTTDDDQSVAAIASAEEAAKKGDAAGVMHSLKAGGKWALDAATKIGTAVAAKAIEAAIGL